MEPFGGERELLARAVSLLMILAMRDCKNPDAIMDASDAIMRSMMPGDWIGQGRSQNVDPEKKIRDGIEGFEAVASKLYG